MLKHVHSRIMVCILVFCLGGCGVFTHIPVREALQQWETATPRDVPGLTAQEVQTLQSIVKVDSYPLYVMHYSGDYADRPESVEIPVRGQSPLHTAATGHLSDPAWACSLFAVLGDQERLLYGRNFDWEYSPALLLYVDPTDGYASLSMVDLAYLELEPVVMHDLDRAALDLRVPILHAPYLPFDGMNEAGLAVGMAAVPPGEMRMDPAKPTIGSLRAIRMILDGAASIEEAVAILHAYNIDMEGGPPLHYLIADASGRSVLVEFYQGRIAELSSTGPWQVATNFLVQAARDALQGHCWRFDQLSASLRAAKGQLTAVQALSLLEDVAQENTQWSIVYDMSNFEAHVVMGRSFGQPMSFSLKSTER